MTTEAPDPNARRHWRPRDFGLHEYGFELNRPKNRHERRSAMKKKKKGKKGY